MKFKFLLLFVFLYFASWIHGQNSFSIPDINAGPGEKATILIDLDNKDEVVGFQFTLTVPDGVVVNQSGIQFTGRSNGHAFYPKEVKKNEFLFLAFHMQNESFKDNTGALLEIPIEIPLNYNQGQTYNITLTNVILSSKEAQDIGSNHTNGILRIVESVSPDLKVTGIQPGSSVMSPENTINISWGVENIGQSDAVGSWTEQITVVSETTGIRYLLGSVFYDEGLKANQSVSRNGTFNIPRIIGIDGNVKIEIKVIPSLEIREPESLRENNTTLSSIALLLEKKLYLSLTSTSLELNSGNFLRATLTQSGDRSQDYVYQVTDLSGLLDIPSTVTINKDASSTYFDIRLKENISPESVETINVKIVGNGYEGISKSIEIINNRIPDIQLSTSHQNAKIGDIISVTLKADVVKNTDTRFVITSNHSRRWTLPQEVILKAGSKSASFNVEVLDTRLPEASVVGTITAKAEGYPAKSVDIILSQENIPEFAFAISPEIISESDGLYAAYGILKRLDKFNIAVDLHISGDMANALILPDAISFGIGQEEVKFNIGVVDNNIVDTTRIVNVSASVYIPSCDCTGSGHEGETNTTYTRSIKILDNDGLALILKANPSTVKAGQANVGIITIERNTTNLIGSVTVTLSSDSPSIVDIPSTAFIPAGSNSVDVKISTKIDPSKTGDQNVRIQAEATDYSSGFVWVLVTDQNKPDILISGITVPDVIDAGEITEIKTNFVNQGFTKLLPGGKVEYYLSKSKNSVDGLTPFKVSTFSREIEAGQSYEFIESVQMPELAGEYYLIVAFNSDFKLSELTYTNNQLSVPVKLIPGYSATAQTDKKIYKTGEKVVISGQTLGKDNKVRGNKVVEINVRNGEYSRTFTTRSNSTGNYSYEFEPLKGESGSYEMSVGYPGDNVPTQVSFDILGFEWIDKPDYLKWEVTKDEPHIGEIKLKNNTKTALSGIKIVLPSGVGFSMTTKPLNLLPGETGVLKYTILANVVSDEFKFYPTNIEIVSNEGASLAITSYYYCRSQVAKLRANPVSINTTMVKNAVRNYEFQVINSSAVEAKNVEVAIPKLEWMTLKTPQIIASLAAGDTAKIILELKPTFKQQLNVPLSGSLAVNPENGDGLTIPFRIETVSDATGKLQIDVVDEYTYYTASAPHVAGAKVIVRHPFSGKVLAEGLTDSNGLFTTEDIPEGYYTVTISAEKHNTYQNNYLVDPGKTNKEIIFLSYQAISYDWTVVPTEIEDEYRIDLDVKFETNAPKPVIIMKVDNPQLDMEPGQSRMSYITLTNHGLIKAQQLSIKIDKTLGDYTLTPMVNYLDELNAKSSVTIPLLIERKVNKGMRSSSDCSTVPVTTFYYECNKETGKWDAIQGDVIYVEVCKSNGGFIWGWGPGGYGPSFPSGSSGPGLDSCDDCNPGIYHEVDCRRCGDRNWDAVFGCGSFIVGLINPVAGIGVSVVGLGGSLLGGGSPSEKVEGAVSTGAGIGLTIAGEKLGGASGTAASVGGNIVGGIGCIGSMGSWFNDECYKQFMGKSSLTVKVKGTTLQIDNKKIPQYLESIKRASELSVLLIDEYFKHDAWYEEEKIDIFWDMIKNRAESNGTLSETNINYILNNFEGSKVKADDITIYLKEWNKSIIAFANETSDMGYIDLDKVGSYATEFYKLEEYAASEGFNSTLKNERFSAIKTMTEAIYEVMKEFSETHQEPSKASVCASVTVRFSQELTMTREAFEGTLTINNGSDAGDLKEVNLEMIIKDEDGNDCTHLFQINKDSFLNGTGVVPANKSETGKAIFIPTKEAAPTVPKSYSFGGKFSYIDPTTNEKVTIDLYPVTLDVNPSPDLVLHYFMQRDILGDDPLTEAIEPMVPAELSLLIDNQGHGMAKNVKVESVQPEIIENSQGLSIEFEMIGSNLNGESRQLGLLDINFGNIEPLSTAVGQWWFTSTLLGHFIEYDVNVTHLSSYGNKNLSLIKAAYIHELIKSVKAYDMPDDGSIAFLVNDIKDMYDTPDMMYLSNGESEGVSKATAISVSNPISSDMLTTELVFNPGISGWNYGNISDPGSNLYKLERVVRLIDSKELPVDNFWQTHVTLHDGQDPVYENTLHFVDKTAPSMSNVKYTLYYAPKDTNVPKVISFGNVTDKSVVASPIEYVQVNFNKAIDASTFTLDNVKLSCQGIQLDVEKVIIGKVNDSIYSLNINELTHTSGLYELTVQCVGIKDLLGNEGMEGKMVAWTQAINELAVIQFKSNQIKSQPINSIQVLLNKMVEPSQFAKDKLRLNGEPLGDNVSVSTPDNITYSITGLNEYNQANGMYEFSVNLTDMVSTDGKSGIVPQSYTWKVNTIIPKVKTFMPVSQGAVNNQNITDMYIILNKPLANEFKPDWVKLYKGSADQNVSAGITKQDSLTYLISGLGDYTATAGGYKLVVDQSGFTDWDGYNGIGTADTAWTVSFDRPLPPVNMKIVPDRGISDVDFITSGEDLAISLETVTDNQLVTLYVITPTGETLLDERTVVSVGEISIPVSGYVGSNTFKVIAYDSYGNASEPISIEVYIDNSDLDATFSIVNLEDDCGDIGHILVNFTDDIVASDFDKDVVTVKAGGLSVSSNHIIQRVSDKQFKINNLENIVDNGDVQVYVDLTSLQKKLSGLKGRNMVYADLGSLNSYPVDIYGDSSVGLDSIATYTASPGMLTYEWSVTGGEIVEYIENTVRIKWTAIGSQTLTLNYVNPNRCIRSMNKDVVVTDLQSIEEESNLSQEIFIAPSVNDGRFSIFVKDVQGTFTLSIYDLAGKLVYREDKVVIVPDSQKNMVTGIDVAGSYFLILENKDEKYLSRFMLR